MTLKIRDKQHKRLAGWRMQGKSIGWIAKKYKVSTRTVLRHTAREKLQHTRRVLKKKPRRWRKLKQSYPKKLEKIIQGKKDAYKGQIQRFQTKAWLNEQLAKINKREPVKYEYRQGATTRVMYHSLFNKVKLAKKPELIDIIYENRQKLRSRFVGIMRMYDQKGMEQARIVVVGLYPEQLAVMKRELDSETYAEYALNEKIIQLEMRSYGQGAMSFKRETRTPSIPKGQVIQPKTNLTIMFT